LHAKAAFLRTINNFNNPAQKHAQVLKQAGSAVRPPKGAEAKAR
jgi:hypothetical protein